MDYYVEYSPNGNPAEMAEVWHDTQESAQCHARQLKLQGYKYVSWNDMEDTL